MIVDTLDCPYRYVTISQASMRGYLLGIEIRAVREGVVDTVLVG
ncbi:hypothetical protein [Bradyrhizobium ottawaense]|nr:hypothetical protein [Bradyrhizobium ottawaense]